MTEGVKKCYEFPRVFGDQFALWLEAHLVLAIHDHNICPRRTLKSFLSQFQGKVSFKQGIATTILEVLVERPYNNCTFLSTADHLHLRCTEGNSLSTHSTRLIWQIGFIGKVHALSKRRISSN